MRDLLNSMKTSLPKYNLVQPSTGKLLVYRPFTVKEEKNLLMANQTGSYEDFLVTLADLIDNCFELDVDAKKLPLFDIEYFFLKLRSKSVGEIVEPTIVCPATREKIKLMLNIDSIEPITFPEHSNKIKIASDILVTMKYPSLENIIKRSSRKTDYFDLLMECIDTIQTKHELIDAKTASMVEIEEFINLLTTDQYKKLIEFFKTTPKLEKEIKYKTKDDVERIIILRGIRDFFQ